MFQVHAPPGHEIRNHEIRNHWVSTLSRILDYGAELFSPGLSIPEGVHPVSGFEVERYLGRWYEIARFDHFFERGLSHVMADYSMGPDGDVEVVNRGYDSRRDRWQEARGIARFLNAPDVASLKVSFFRPIWGGYYIFALDQEHYRWAMISGATHSYLWILCREKTMEPSLLESLLQQAQTAGFEPHKLVMVPQD
jgi:apolipoprotein D and lipocalin family protein